MASTYDVSMFKDTFEHEFTWLNGFLRNVGRFGEKPALHDPLNQQTWTYKELNAEANRLAHALMDDDVGRGDILMYMLPNSAEFAFCYLAGHKIGTVGCPVNYRLAPGELALILDDSRPAVFIYDVDHTDIVLQALSMASHEPRTLVIVGRGKVPEGHIAFEDYRSDSATDDPIPSERSHIYDESIRLYTSGTTSQAKSVPINIINEVLSAHDVMMHFPLNSTDITMNMTPWFHRGGLHSGGLTPTFYAGAAAIILREFHPRRCLSYVEEYEVTFLIGVPSILALLARAQERLPARLETLRGIVTMGSPFEKAACEEYRKLFTVNIFNGYGTTETFWNTFLRPYNLPEMAGSAGQACTDDDVRVVRLSSGGHTEPDDLVAKDGKTVGEIIIKSPTKSTYCYVNNTDLSKERFYKGFHYTGDLGTWDTQEFVTVVGRKDDMIVCAGENIYPTQIEEILNGHPKVVESAVLGLPDKRHGQCVAAWVVPKDDSLTVEELKSYCISHPMLSRYKCPKIFNLIKELPHTATGKLSHYRLREQELPKNDP